MRASIALCLVGCTSSNPEFVRAGSPFDRDAGAADLARGAGDGAAPPDRGAVDLATAKAGDLLSARDLAGGDLAAGGPAFDVAEDVLATWGVGESGDDNPVACNPAANGGAVLAADPAHVVAGKESVRVTYGPDRASYFQAYYPKARSAGWNLTGRTGVALSVDALLPQGYGGWDPPSPTVILCGAPGWRRLDPTANVLPRAGAGFVALQVPLAGGGSWRATDSGGFSLAKVQWIEIHADPLRNNGTGSVVLWIDGVRFY